MKDSIKNVNQNQGKLKEKDLHILALLIVNIQLTH